MRFYDTLMESLAICIVDLSKCNSDFVFNFIWDGWIHFPETMFETFFFFFFINGVVKLRWHVSFV